MPSIKPESARNVAKVLLHGRVINDDQWGSILEDHRVVFARLMKDFSVGHLGELSCLDAGNGLSHNLSIDNPRVDGCANYALFHTRGIFAGGTFARRHPSNTIRTFGIDRHGSWVLIEIAYSLQEGSSYEKAEVVIMSQCDIRTLLMETRIAPSVIWEFLKYTMQLWVRDREQKYETVLKISGRMVEENAVISLIG